MAPNSILWLARHELRLAWRDIAYMTAGGKPGRMRKIAVIALVVLAGLHGMALLTLRRVGTQFQADLPTLVAVTATLLLSGSAMLSQAIESVTRTFYTRSDLELILSSPVPASRVFAVRIGAIALSGSLMSLFLFGPFVNVLVWQSGWRWLGAYGVIVAVSAVATALATALTVTLFQIIGPRRTRLAAQLAAAMIGGAFVIGLQLAAMFSAGTNSRLAFLRSQTVLARVPGIHSVLWWPARAALGDGMMVAAVVIATLALLLATIAVYAPRFADTAITARGTSERTGDRNGLRAFCRASGAAAPRFLSVRTPQSALRRKEILLLLRDPWLISQSLMQLFYLLPPAVMLWHTFTFQGRTAVVVIPVLIMAAGQLAGGLAWLTISGEDAPDLVLTAPIHQSRIWRAKVEAVMQCVGIAFAPFVLALLLLSPRFALIAAAGIAASAASSTVIQLWFRSQAKRSQFRRRHTSSRIATFSEAFSSITWSAAGGVAAVSSWLGGIVALMALGLLAAVRFLSPARSEFA